MYLEASVVPFDRLVVEAFPVTFPVKLPVNPLVAVIEGAVIESPSFHSCFQLPQVPLIFPLVFIVLLSSSRAI